LSAAWIVLITVGSGTGLCGVGGLTLGGGSNFGIVTDFKFQAFPHAHLVYHGLILFSPSQLFEVVAAYEEFWACGGQDPKSSFSILLMHLPPNFTPVICVMAFYDGDESFGRKCFKPFLETSPLADLTGLKSYLDGVQPTSRFNPFFNIVSRLLIAEWRDGCKSFCSRKEIHERYRHQHNHSTYFSLA
jgi:hypothetical protein